MDFFQIKERSPKRDTVEVYPDFKVCRSKDLMVRSKGFYAIWNDKDGMWSTDEFDVQRLTDEELYKYRDDMRGFEGNVNVKSMVNFSSGSWAEFRKYMNNISDSYVQLDEKLTFSNTKVTKKDYVSKRLNYPLEPGKYSAYDEIIGTLYDPEERAKLEWAIGAIISGEAKSIQKFIVLYGDPGAGKGTIINIIQKLFEGYYTTFDAKSLASASNAFSTEVFKANPLVAIQHDGDLSKIEDNSKLNSIVSHEEMTMNEKHKPQYTSRVNAFLFMATNKPVKITDAKSGIIRRLIDVRPSGRKLPAKSYHSLMSQIDFELGAIASHCLDVYREMGMNYYSSYRPMGMIFQTDVFFNFVEANFDTFQEEDGVSLSRAYDIYKQYCDEALVDFKLPRHKFREELKNYFRKFDEITRIDGKQVRSYYSEFIEELFLLAPKPKPDPTPCSLTLEHTTSLLDDLLADCKAQYASSNGRPTVAWDSVKTKLSDIDTSKTHYLKGPERMIFLDFDLKDASGEKSAALNLEAASKWPPTYAEYSNGGQGIHLHYFYDGDPSTLQHLYSEGIEIKTCVGGSSIRRRLSKCNSIPVATINSGLPTKEKKMVDFKSVKTEAALRDLIKRNLLKEFHAGTKSSIDFIHKILEDAYNSGLKYDVSDMRQRIFIFASNSTNNSEYCIKLISEMKFKSDEPSLAVTNYAKDDLVFFDVEVFPNLFLVVWKFAGPKASCVRMINPSPKDIEMLMQFKLVGFNCRRYDNHILYGRYMGYTNEQLYMLSKRIVNSEPNSLFGEAYNMSYTDVYDFASSVNKKSLKKFEIELGIHHMELGLPWDKPVPESMWTKVAEYCDNDVIATEAVFNHLADDWTARKILSDLSGLSVNDTTNQHSIRIVFGDNKKPQSEFNYRKLSEPVSKFDPPSLEFLKKHDILPIPFERKEGSSVLPYFPGYRYSYGKSIYMGEEVGEGGYVYAEPGVHWKVALLDVASEHPFSAIAEVLFGPKFTERFYDIVDGRVSIKHKDWEKVNIMLDGKLAQYVDMVKRGEITAKKLANALKTAINSAYGLTAAGFENPFRDPRNVDNIVAKRGALFMVDLKYAVQEKGFTVAHIKTDSIKIPNATKEIIQFVMDFGRKYGYNFEHEATYDRMCLVNDAVYIAKYMTADSANALYGYIPEKCQEHGGEWTATGSQFAHPYVFKTLFSKEAIEFSDMCEVKSVTSAIYLDMNEKLEDVSAFERELVKIEKKLKEPDPRLNEFDIRRLQDRANELAGIIPGGHDYQFVGKTGLFCPIKPGFGGGYLVRDKDGKFYSVGGTKGYRWMESEVVKLLEKEDCIDINYYSSLVDDAVANISKYGDFEMFAHEDSTPPWILPCGKSDPTDTCFTCPNFVGGPTETACSLGYRVVPF